MRRIEQSLGAFSLAFFGVVMVPLVTVTATFPGCSSGRFANVPWAATATIVVGDERDLVITVKSDRSVFVGMDIVPPEAIESELLRSARTIGTDRHVLIEADGAVPYASVEQILRATRTAGFNRVSLITFRGTRLDAWQRGAAV